MVLQQALALNSGCKRRLAYAHLLDDTHLGRNSERIFDEYLIRCRDGRPGDACPAHLALAATPGAASAMQTGKDSVQEALEILRGSVALE